MGDCAPLEWWTSGCPQLAGGQSGSLAPGESESFEFNLDTFGAPPGDYACNLTVHTDSPLSPSVTIPVNYTIEGPITDAAPGACYATKNLSLIHI